MYDLIVLGGGPGGYVATILAAKKGLNVLLVEKNRVGGVCLNKGCIPTKTMIHYVKVKEKVDASVKNGVFKGEISLDYYELFKKKNKVTDKYIIDWSRISQLFLVQ